MKPSTEIQATLEGIRGPEADEKSRRAPSIAGRLAQVEKLIAVLKSRLELCAAESRPVADGAAPACPGCRQVESALERAVGRQDATERVLVALIESDHDDVRRSRFAARLPTMRPDPNWSGARKEGAVAAMRTVLQALQRVRVQRGR